MPNSSETRQRAVDQHIGAGLKLARIEGGIGISTLSRMAGIEIERLMILEAGEARAIGTELFDLADALNIRLSSLFEGLD